MVMVVTVSFIRNVCHCVRSVYTVGKRCLKLWIAACFCCYACFVTFVSWTKVTCSSRNYLGILIFNYKGKRCIYGTCWIRFRLIVANRLFETSLLNIISFLSFFWYKRFIRNCEIQPPCLLKFSDWFLNLLKNTIILEG